MSSDDKRERWRKANNKMRHKRIEDGLCVRCAKKNDRPGYLCSVCLSKYTETRNKKRESGICLSCAKPVTSGYKYCEEHVKKNREYLKRYRNMVLDHYGRYCACCGETTIEFLAIDHINGGGSKHRKEVSSGYNIYRWLINNNYPDGYQILCHNCNQAKGFYGECPHERERRKEKIHCLSGK